MKHLLALSLVVMFCLACNLGRSNNANSKAPANAPAALTTKDRFVGTWVPTDPDFGPITFKSDDTYSAQHSNNPNSSTITGSFEIRRERLYCKGELAEQTADGFKLEGDRISLSIKGEVIYFKKR